MNRFLALAVFFFSLVSGAGAWAADDASSDNAPPNESLEWLVIARPSIAIAEVTSTVPSFNPKINNNELTIEARLKETLKGHPPQQATFIRRWQEGGQNRGGAIRPDNGTEYLLFFDDEGAVTNAINLRFPSRRLGVGVDVGDVPVSSDFTVLKSGEVIKDLVRRRLSLIPPNAAETPKQVEVPLDVPAWAVFYDGSTSYLLVPDEAQNKSEGTPLERTVKFSGTAMTKQCNNLPHVAFEIKSIVEKQPHTVAFLCSPFPGKPELQQIAIMFRIKDIAKDADYDFDWGSDPDAVPQKKAFFRNQQACAVVADMLQASILHDPMPLAADPGVADNGPPMVATWKADCVPSEAWGYSVAFELNVRYAPKNDAGSNVAPPVPAPVAPAVAPPVAAPAAK